jgi:hypothetical protein
MGSFSVPIKVSNWQNRYLPAERRGETLETDALVDTGAVELALPAELAERLRLEEIGSVQAETADGGFHRLRVLGMVEVEVKGRSAQVRVIELARGDGLACFPTREEAGAQPQVSGRACRPAHVAGVASPLR